ncbi:MAG: CotH kinase family protein [Lachnospiraceae bacterium]|nr:CotH kinase family protein [Lachnospiraceae bacterium]
MNKKRMMLKVLALSILLIGISFFAFLSNKQSEPKCPINLVLTDGINIKPWYNELDDTFCFFLPSYVDPKEVCLNLNNDTEVLFGSRLIKKGDSIGECSIGRTYTISDNKNSYQINIRILQSDNIATVYVQTATDSMDYVYKSKDSKEVINLTIVDNEGNKDYSSSNQKIKGHGNTTWNYEKKPFSILLTEPESILGMEQSSKWILLANAGDKSGIRNAMVFETAKAFGMDNAPEYRFVDLYLNGEYNGVYILCQSYDTFYERNGLGEDDLYLFTAELPERLYEMNYAIYAENNEALVDVSIPKKLKIDEKKYADSVIKKLDDVITKQNDQLDEVIDLTSWVQKYLIDEIFENYDAGMSSSYFYIYANATNAKVFAGPLWDYDNIMGNTRNTSNPKILYADQKYRTKTERLLWYYELNTNPVFRDKVVQSFETILIPLIDELINAQISSLSQEISIAKANNDIRWRIESDRESEFLINYLSERLEFLKSIWLDGDEYCEVAYYGGDKAEDFKRIFIHKGDSVLNYPEYLKLISGGKWYIDGTSTEYDFSSKVNENVLLVKKDAGKKSLLRSAMLVIKDLKLLVIIGTIIILGAVLALYSVTSRRNKGVI